MSAGARAQALDALREELARAGYIADAPLAAALLLMQELEGDKK